MTAGPIPTDAGAAARGIRSASLNLLSPGAGATAQPGGRPSLLAQIMAEQRSLTAVERFAEVHESCGIPSQQKYYRDLIPLERPGPGQQYAFEVDLGACTGCKACVSACHSLNGLDEGESWRSVGLLHGGSAGAPAQATVTTSCHHCVDPGCMKGCPVKAYEKDPVTGIVRHLDDQCIGCKYCTLMCPYDAPKYSEARGIVRKCDMCTDRLASNEAPACVQACPNQAIRIAVVESAAATKAGREGAFLAGAPDPDHTLPTTVYRGGQAAVTGANLVPADLHSATLEHAHMPLVMMLLLSQLGVGTLAVDWIVRRLAGMAAGVPAIGPAAIALALGVLGIGAATFHLGRPLYAFRAVLGLRTSWMSREVVAFGLFVKLAALYAFVCGAALPAWAARAGRIPGLDLLASWAGALQAGVVAVGAVGVLCSVMIYAATRRAYWRGAPTAARFFGTTLVLGAAAEAAIVGAGPARATLLGIVFVSSAIKLAWEASMVLGPEAGAAAGAVPSATERAARAMRGPLRAITLARFAAGIVGGVVLPLAPLAGASGGSAAPRALLFAMLVLLALGELAERYLFFRAAPPSRMPGAIA